LAAEGEKRYVMVEVNLYLYGGDQGGGKSNLWGEPDAGQVWGLVVRRGEGGYVIGQGDKGKDFH